MDNRQRVNSLSIVGRLSTLQSVHYQRLHCSEACREGCVLSLCVCVRIRSHGLLPFHVWAGVAILCMYVSYGYIYNHVTWFVY